MKPETRAQRNWFVICAVCLAAYIAYITYLAGSKLFINKVQTIAALLCFAALSVGLYFFLTRACNRLAALPAPKAGERRRWVFGAALVISLAVLGCAFAACYPGGVNYDVANQWQQAHSGEFNNWHPVFHTLLLWLVSRVRDSYPFVVAVQIVVFSLALSYLTHVLHRSGVPAWLALCAHTLVCLSQPVRNPLMYAGKDAAMTIGIVVLCAQSIRLLYSRGRWLKNPWHALAFGLLLAYTDLVRKNGMMWTLVLLVCVFFAYRACRRQTLLSAGVMAAVLLLVQGPLYGALDVVYPSNFTEESVGVPMTVLWDIRASEPDRLDPQADAFLRELSPGDDWREIYQLHNYNSIKFTYAREYVRDMPVGQIAGMALRSAANAPRTAFEAVNGLTELVWDISGQNKGYMPVGNGGQIGEAAYTNRRLNRLGQAALDVLDAPMQWAPVRWLTQNIGVQMLLLLLVTLWSLRRSGAASLTLAFPTLTYNLGTMALLCGNDARFFQFTMTISIASVLALIYLPKEEEA